MTPNHNSEEQNSPQTTRNALEPFSASGAKSFSLPFPTGLHFNQLLLLPQLNTSEPLRIFRSLLLLSYLHCENPVTAILTTAQFPFTTVLGTSRPSVLSPNKTSFRHKHFSVYSCTSFLRPPMFTMLITLYVSIPYLLA